MIKKFLGKLRWRLCHMLFRDVIDVINEVVTEYIHPEFGSIWMPPDGEAYLQVKSAFITGYEMAQLDFVRDGVRFLERKPPEFV